MAPKQVLIGVATTVQPKERMVKGRRVRRPAIHYCRMAEYAGSLGARLMIFDPDNANWTAGQLSGWRPVNMAYPYRDWERCEERLPDAIYENVFVHLAVKGKSSKMRAAAKERGIPLFNPPLPSKWQAVSFMKSAGLGQYVPDTFVLSDIKRAVRAVDEWKVTYVKPVGGYGGSGVMRIETTGKQMYRVSMDRSVKGTRKQRIMVTRSDLEKLLRNRSRVPHLVQKGIRLLKIDGRSVDFRVVTARGADGAWHVIGIVPKVAAADGVVTNIVAGGELMSLEQLESLTARQGITVPVRELTACAVRCSEKLAERIPKTGLLGYDIGVDTNGKVFVIEVNPKPARSLLTDDMKRLMAKHTAGFTVFLARRRGALKVKRSDVRMTAASWVQR
ncbi:YheC/YheD family protein [Alicyclobacillus curvatus]|nr:YheC/YheD family protein [Alicyclobacillus curvatus]